MFADPDCDRDLERTGGDQVKTRKTACLGVTILDVLAISNHGQNLVYSTNRPLQELWLYDIERGESVAITADDGKPVDAEVRFSPDDRRLVYMEDAGARGERSVVVVDMDALKTLSDARLKFDARRCGTAGDATLVERRGAACQQRTWRTNRSMDPDCGQPEVARKPCQAIMIGVGMTKARLKCERITVERMIHARLRCTRITVAGRSL